MSNYNPNSPFNVPAFLLKPTRITVKGVTKKIFTAEEKPFFCSFRTFGGTEKNINGVYSIEDTATIETWYRPDIKSDCKIAVVETKEEFEILNTPENINMRNQFLKFKVKSAKGGA